MPNSNDVLTRAFDPVAGALRTTAQLAGDVQIGNVEIKDANSATTASVGTTNPVTAASGLTTRNIPMTVSTSSVTSVASSATNVTLLASTAGRRQATFYNDSTAILYLKLGATASATSHTVQIIAGGYYELPQPVYTGIVDGIWASANGSARITELT